MNEYIALANLFRTWSKIMWCHENVSFLTILEKKCLKLDDMPRFNENLGAWWNVCCQIMPVGWDFLLSDIFQVAVSFISLKKV